MALLARIQSGESLQGTFQISSDGESSESHARRSSLYSPGISVTLPHPITHLEEPSNFLWGGHPAGPLELYIERSG